LALNYGLRSQKILPCTAVLVDSAGWVGGKISNVDEGNTITLGGFGISDISSG